jgi:hypothetical protein
MELDELTLEPYQCRQYQPADEDSGQGSHSEHVREMGRLMRETMKRRVEYDSASLGTCSIISWTHVKQAARSAEKPRLVPRHASS